MHVVFNTLFVSNEPSMHMCTVLSSHELSMNLLLLIASNCTFPPSYPTYTLVSGTLTFLPREDGAKHVFKKIKNGMKHLIYIYFQNTFRARIFFPYFFVKYWTCFVQSLAPVLTVSLSVSQIGCGLSVRELWVPGSCTTFFPGFHIF